MLRNKATAGKLTIAATMVAVIVGIIVGIRVSSNTPATTTAGQEGQTLSTAQPSCTRHFKVLHIMSYHSPWEWTDDQFSGFKDALGDLDVEYKVYQMDAKRRSSEQWLQQAGKEARQLIEEWKPDLVYTSDDTAQEYVVKYYINSDIPFVFSAVNSAPEDYGFTKAKNITGVLEQEHVTQTVRLLRELVPGVRKIAIISDPAPMWRKVAKRIEEKEGLGDIEVVANDVVATLEDWERTVKGYEGKADAIALLGVFNIQGPDGKNLPFHELGRWTSENSNLPDFSFWKDRVSDGGTLCAVGVSGFAQGQGAGKIARAILVEGKSPSDFPMVPTTKGEPVISLARARKLGLTPSAQVLLTARVFAKFKWEN